MNLLPPKPANLQGVATATQDFAVSAETLYDAWLQPALIGQWMFGPNVRDEEIVRIVVDARVGGSYAFDVCRNGVLVQHAGEYLELDRPDCLTMTWGIVGGEGSRVEVKIASNALGCNVTVSHYLHPDWLDQADRAAAAWMTMLSALRRILTPSQDGDANACI